MTPLLRIPTQFHRAFRPVQTPGFFVVRAVSTGSNSRYFMAAVSIWDLKPIFDAPLLKNVRGFLYLRVAAG